MRLGALQELLECLVGVGCLFKVSKTISREDVVLYHLPNFTFRLYDVTDRKLSMVIDGTYIIYSEVKTFRIPVIKDREGISKVF